MKLTAKAVQDVLTKCFYTDAEIGPAVPKEPPVGAVCAEAVRAKYAFHPKRLEAAKPEIAGLLQGLPDLFHEAPSKLSDGDLIRDGRNPGGGWSFLNACMTRDDVQWGEHSNVDELLALGVAAGYVRWSMPREMWRVLPGGVPYFIIDKAVWA